MLLPHAGIGWQAHIGGLAGGIVGGWIFRDRAVGTATRTEVNQATAGVVTKADRKVNQTVPQSATSGLYSGPRGDLPKQLDDLGL